MEYSDDDTVNTASPAENDLQEGDYIITKLINAVKTQQCKQFIGKIIFNYEECNTNEFLVSFQKRKPNQTVVLPDIKYQAFLNISDIVIFSYQTLQ